MDENEEALKLVEKAIEIDPNSTDNFALKAKILRAQNKGDEALRCINRALSLDDNHDNHLTKAHRYCCNSKDYQRH
jgi:tetratricopeptide (TPR) repeat protein